MPRSATVERLLEIGGGTMPATEAMSALTTEVDTIRHVGLSPEEVADLACGIAESGSIHDWRKDPDLGSRITVDLPSTGGASNKTPIVAPLLAVAAAGDRLFVPKISTRGSIAGTIDILESIGYRPELPPGRYREILLECGISNVLPAEGLAPADGRLMRLRRTVGAMDVRELVVGSILGKKIATGCRNLVIDLKVGQDSKVGDFASTLEAARFFADVGVVLRERDLLDGIWIVGTNTFRSQGRAFGRIAALWEALRVLAGLEKGLLTDLAVELAGRMVALARGTMETTEAVAECRSMLGARVLNVTRRWLRAHEARTDALDVPDRLLENIRKTAFELGERGQRLVRLDTRRIGQVMKSLSQDPHTAFTAGLILDRDPADGAELPLGARCLLPEGISPDAAIAQLASSVDGYEGQANIVPRPGILFEIIETRDGRLERKAWSRASTASIALISNEELRYLMVFNRKWKAWTLLAGHREATRDADVVATAAREIEEELGPELGEAAYERGKDFTCSGVGTRRELWYSESAGQWTFYDFTIVATRFRDLHDLKTRVARHPGMLRWGSEQEIRRGRTDDGADIAAFPCTVLALDGFPGGSQ